MKWEGEYPPPPLEGRFANRFDSAWSKQDEEKLLENIAIERRRLLQMEMRLWAAPVDWLESLPRARWWIWLRENFQILMAMLFLIGSLWGSWYLWKWFVRAL